MCLHYNIAIECASLDSPDNGTISYSRNPTNGLYIHGTVATYSCSPGFGLSSTQSRVCVGDGDSKVVGRFNGSEPLCEGKDTDRQVLHLVVFFEQPSLALLSLLLRTKWSPTPVTSPSLMTMEQQLHISVNLGMS